MSKLLQARPRKDPEIRGCWTDVSFRCFKFGFLPVLYAKTFPDASTLISEPFRHICKNSIWNCCVIFTNYFFWDSANPESKTILFDIQEPIWADLAVPFRIYRSFFVISKLCLSAFYQYQYGRCGIHKLRWLYSGLLTGALQIQGVHHLHKGHGSYMLHLNCSINLSAHGLNLTTKVELVGYCEYFTPSVCWPTPGVLGRCHCDCSTRLGGPGVVTSFWAPFIAPTQWIQA